MAARLCEIMWLAHMASCLFMVGVIWVMQVVHYPLFGGVGVERFADYARRHQQLMTRVVAPAMLLEATTGVALAYWRPTGIPSWGIWIGLALLAVNWSSTSCLQVPCHAALLQGYCATAHSRLVRTNWLRTIAWSLRGILVLWMAWSRFAADSPAAFDATSAGLASSTIAMVSRPGPRGCTDGLSASAGRRATAVAVSTHPRNSHSQPRINAFANRLDVHP